MNLNEMPQYRQPETEADLQKRLAELEKTISKQRMTIEEDAKKLLTLQDENEKLLKQSESAERELQDTAKLRGENQRLRDAQGKLKREHALLRKKFEEAKAGQKTVYRDRIVRAMACQACRKSEYEREIEHLKTLRCMNWCLWGAVALLAFLALNLLKR